MARDQIMSAADHERVSEAVHAAEQQTSGEIVTILADHSDRYLDVALWWSVVAAVLALAVLTAFPDFYVDKIDQLTGGWNPEWEPREYFELALAVVILKFAGTRLLMQWIPLRLFLTPGIVKSRAGPASSSISPLLKSARKSLRTKASIWLCPMKNGAKPWRICWDMCARAGWPRVWKRRSAMSVQSWPIISRAAMTM
jgi:putative membrane protein